MELNPNSPACIFATLAAGSALKYIAGYYFYSKDQNRFKVVGRVADLYIYPVKSFGGIKVEEGVCTPLGLSCFGVTDRHWAVAGENGLWVTQRQEPSMALIRVQVEGDRMQLDAPHMETIYLPLNPPVTPENLSKITVKTDTVESVDCGDEVAEWLCKYFNRTGLRLHFSAPSLEKRSCKKNQKNWIHPAQAEDIAALHDYCGFMMLSNPSLAVLNQNLSQNQSQAVPITNFRANIIVDECSAFEEDSWIGVRIGDAQLRVLDACTRCVLVTVDQERGLKDPKEEPLATLKQFRLRPPYGPKPAFGINLTLDKPGKICVGDLIYAQRGQHQVRPKPT